MLLLVPCDPINPRRPDEHFAAETAAARAADWGIGLYDHDRVVAGSSDAVRWPAGGTGPVLMRGWMLSASHYAVLEEQVVTAGGTMVTSASQYKCAHELPGWYRTFRDLTPQSAWIEGNDPAALVAASSALPEGGAVIKDYVKSLKHRWEDACWIPNVRDIARLTRTAKTFVELRDRDLQGGLVVRAFERLEGPELRTWWIDGTCRMVTAHPDTPDQMPADRPSFDDASAAVLSLNCRFVTLDWAKRADGGWRVIEVGDGQVSDRPRSMDAEAFIAALRL